MNSSIRRFLGKFFGPDSHPNNPTAADPEDQRSVELENLEPRMLFSAAPVEAPAETPDPEAAAAEAQAAEESVIDESPATTTASPSIQVAAPVPLGSTVVNQAAAHQTAVSLEGSELEGEDELGSVGAAYSMEKAAADTAATLAATEISQEQNVNLVDLNAQAAELNQETLEAIADAAANRWKATGLSAAQRAALDNATYEIADLDGGNLGTVLGSTITLDVDAGGRGWFADATPDEDSEFGQQLADNYLKTENGAWIGYDLLSVMMHEQGHLLGVTHAAPGTAGNVMTDYFSPNQRILPVDGQAAGATPGTVPGGTYATFNVTTTADSGTGSLRMAISDANNAAGADTIEFSGGGIGTINLLTQITITDDVHINSNQVGGITINQTGANERVFEVQGGTGLTAEATTFDTLTISGGARTNSVGGGVYINGWADVSFDNVDLRDNSATEGGGFYVAGSLGAKVTLTDSDIFDNKAIVRGGGFRNSGFDTLVTMSDGKIDNNFVSNEHGGGFYNNGKVVLTNVDITNNSVNDLDNTNGRFDDSYGGGFFNNASGLHPNAGQVSITGGKITDNKAFGHAGGFWNRGGTVTIDGTSGDPVEILRNQAGAAGTNSDTDGKGGDTRSGGGFWATDAATTKLNWVNFGNGTDTTDSNTVTSVNQSNADNDLRGVGAGFFNSSQSKTWLTNVDLSDHRADQGAAFYQDGIQSEIHGTNVTMNDGFARTRGGGFRNATTGALVDLTDSFIDSNIARNEHGGGVYNNGTLNLDNTDISNSIAMDLDGGNRRDAHGGGLYNGGGTVNMTNGSDIRGNSTYGYGGGAWNSGGVLNITDGEIDGNFTIYNNSDRHGGGLWNQADSIANFSNVTISNNYTGADGSSNTQGVGGGFWNTDGSIVNIKGDSQIIGNRAETGGGFYNTSTDSVVNITGTAGNPIEIGTAADPNSARVQGGGFRTTGNTIVNLEHVDIQYNTTDIQRGGGFYADSAQVNGDWVRINNNTAGTEPRSGDEQGGGFWSDGHGWTTLTNSEISDNFSFTSGGGFHADNGVVDISDSKIEGNFSYTSGAGFFSNNSAEVHLTDVSVTDNITRDHGGGFWSEDDSKVSILRTNIDDNLAGYEQDGTTRITGRYGGGFWARGRSIVTIDDSTVDNNEASVAGGAVFLDDDAHLIANGTTFAHNVAGDHGGGFRLDDRSTADITNSTISNNYSGHARANTGSLNVVHTDRVGGGLWTVHSGATANLNHTTVAENRGTSTAGAGLYRSSGNLNIENTLVYGNLGNVDATSNASDTHGNGGVSVRLSEANVIGVNTGGTLQGNVAGLVPGDPGLGALADNGGPTLPDGASPRTHTITATMSADETATGSTVAVDQLGNGRSSDIGAYELDPVASTLTIDDLIVPGNAISGTAFDVEVVTTVVGGTVTSVDWSVDAPVGGQLATGTGATASLTATNPATDPVQTVDVTVTVTSSTGQTVEATTQVRLVDPLAMPMTGTGGAIVTIATDEDDGDVSLGDISLREAIKLANASAAGTFVITFDSSLNGTDIEMSIVPTSGTDNENGNLRGDFDITKSNGVVSIVGNGAANTTINAMQVDRVFDLHSGRIAYFTDLTITGGETTTSDRQGGALYNRGGTAVFKNVDIDGNAAAENTNAAVGGAFYLRADGSNHSATYMTGGSVTNNTAESNGGGIYFEGTNVGESILYLDGTTIGGNTASFGNINLDSRRGGGLYMTDDGNRLVLNNVSVEDNMTIGRNASDGGGLAIAGANHIIDITDTTFVRNQAGDNPGGTGTNDSDGGGFWSATGRSTFNFTNTTFGGELAGGADAAGIGTAVGDGNIAEDEGGGFYTESRFSTYNFVDSKFIGNLANDDGGGFMSVNDTDVFNFSQTGTDLGVIRNNVTLTSNGGGFRNAGATVNIDGTAAIPFEIRYNEARGSVGGGFYTSDNGSTTLKDVVIRGNEARNDGGGFYNNGGGQVKITSSTPSTSGTPGSFISQITGNKAVFADGGAFTSVSANTVSDLTDVLVSGNTATDEGGAFKASSNFSTVNLTNVDVVDNTSQDSGGAFYNESNGSIVNLNNVLIKGNISVTEHGGGFRNNGHVNGTKVTITNNKAGTDLTGDRVGGGFYNPSGRVDLTDVTIDNNWAHARGGGFYQSGGGIVEIDSSNPGTFRSSISNNTVVAASNDGGGFFNTSGGSLVKLTGVDVKNNQAGDQGGGFFQNSDMSRVDLVDVTLDGNNAGNYAGGFRNESAWSIVTLDNTRITNNTTTQHHGGGFWNRGSVTGQDVIISGNRNATAQATADSNDNNVGGGFWNNGDGAYMDLNRVEITNNESHGRGGGVYNDSRAELRLTDFIISGNSTDQDTSESQGRGGGIWNSSGADVFLNRGEISENTSFGHGGGIYSQESGATISATNVTFSGNTAGIDPGEGFEGSMVGGGLWAQSNGGTVAFDHVTFSNNKATRPNADAGGGFRIDSSGINMTMKDTVAYGNFRNAAGALVDDDVDQNITAANFILEGNNIVGFRSGNAMTGGTGSVTEGISAANDPGFFPLLDLGGATMPSGVSPRVHAITVGASASDTAVTSTLTEDQRGITRPQNAVNDIGAYEGPGSIYVNDEWAGSSLGDEFDGDLELAGAQQSFFGISAFESIDAAFTTYAGFSGSIIVNGGDYSGTTATLDGGLVGDVSLQLVQDLTNSETTAIFDSLSGDSLDAIDTSLHGSAVGLIVGDANDTTFDGVISGSGELTKVGAGTLTLTAANTYSGGTAIGDFFTGPADGGTLAITDSAALGTGSVTFEQGGTLSLAAPGLSVANNMNWFNWGVPSSPRTISLDLAGTGAGTLTGNLEVRSSGQNEFEVGTDDTLTVSGNIVNTHASHVDAGFDKNGAGHLILSGNNSHRGSTDVNTGQLTADSNTALGTTANGTTVANNARLELANGVTVTGETVAISGNGGDFSGALRTASGGTAEWAGNVTLNGGTPRIGTESGGSLTVSGNIQDGTGSTLYVNNQSGTGTVIVSGANTYSGATNIVRGTVELGATNSLPTTTTLDVDWAAGAEDSTFDMAGFDQEVAALTRTGTGGTPRITNSGGSGSTLTVNQSTNTTYNGDIQDDVSLVKQNTGTLELTGTYTNTGTTSIDGGTLTQNGTHTGAGAYSVASGATLDGNGSTTGSVTSTGGTVDPSTGANPGTLGVGSTSLDASSNFNVQIDGNTAGDGAGNHDQLDVTGTVAVGGALNLTGTHVPVLAESYTIVSNDGSDDTTGSFTGLAEGSSLTFNGQTLFITYNGGDGNDVVLNTIPEINGTSGNDILTVDMLAGGDLQYQLNSDPTVTLTAPASLTFNGADGDDLLIVNTNDLSLPGGGIEFNGGPQTFPGAGHDPPTPSNGDALQVNGLAQTQDVTYTPNALITGNGTVDIVSGGSGTITFTGLEPVDISGMATATLTLPGADDVIDLANGFDVATGLVPAIVATGTSGGVAIESAHFFNNTTVNIDTTGVAGNDTITITSAGNAHANDNLIIDTGTEAADTVTVNGAATFQDDITITTATFASTAAGQLNSTSGTGTIGIEADSVTLNATSQTNAGAGGVEIDPLTAGTNIHFGNTVLAGELNLSDPEIDTITAGVLQIGDATAGRINFSGTSSGGLITPANANTLHLITGSFVTDGANNNTGGGIRVANLAIEAGGANAGDDRAIRINNTNNGVESRVDTFAASSSDGWIEFREDNNTGTPTPGVGLTIGTVDGVVGVTNTSNTGDNNRERISINVQQGDLVIDDDMSSRRDLFIRALGNQNQIILNAGVTIGHVEGGSLTLRADNIDIEGAINSPDRTVLLQPDDNLNVVHVGAIDVLNDDILEIDQDEINRIAAANITIGRWDLEDSGDAPFEDANKGAGDIIVKSAITVNQTDHQDLRFQTNRTVSQDVGASITVKRDFGIQGRGDVTLTDTGNDIERRVSMDLRRQSDTVSATIDFFNSDSSWFIDQGAGVDNVIRTDNGNITITTPGSVTVDDDADGGSNGVADPTTEVRALAVTAGINGDVTFNIGAGTATGRDFITNPATDNGSTTNLDQVDLIAAGNLTINVQGTSASGDASIIRLQDSTNVDVGGNINFNVNGAGNNNARIEFEGGTTIDAGGTIDFTVDANNGYFETNYDDSNAVTITSTGGTLNIKADRWLVDPNTVINIAGQQMHVTPFAMDDNVILGVGGDATDGNLRINNTELNTVTGALGEITIGDMDTGMITVNGAIDLPVDTVFANTDGDININAAIDNGPLGAPVPGTSSLTINNGAGTTTINADIGSTDALESVTTDATGNTDIADGVSITTTGDQTYNDQVDVSGAGVTGIANIISTGGGLVFDTTTLFNVDLANDTAGTGHDQLDVMGTVTLNNANLDINKLAGFTAGAGDEFILINNDGGDAVVGTFFGLAEGQIISLSVMNMDPPPTLLPGDLFEISYTGGDGNDVVLTLLAESATTNIWLDVDGNLKITDFDETIPGGTLGNSADNITVRVEGNEVIITDLNNTLGTLINGAVQTSANEIRIDVTQVTDFTGDVMIGTLGEDDHITIGDLGDMILPMGIMVDGGDGFDNIFYTGAGSVLTTGSNASFTGEEIDFYLGSDLSTTDGDITATAAGGSGANYQGIHVFDADLSAGGTGAITLSGSGGDTGNSNIGVFLTHGSTLTTNDGDIDIDGTGGGTGAGEKGVMIFAETSLSAGGSGNLTIDGTGSVGGSLQNEGVEIISGTSASVVNGNMTITGTGGGTGGLGFGVSVAGTMLTGTGTGNITINGTSAATGGFNNVGVQIWGTDIDTMAGSGSVTVSGSGSPEGTDNNMGVRLSTANIETGTDASIDIDGTGAGSGANNIGVQLTSDANLTVSGSGTISIDGTGSAAGTVNSYGVELAPDSDLTVANGDLTISGTGGGSALGGINSKGVLASGAILTGSGTGNLSITGTASGVGSNNQGIELANTTLTTAAAGTGSITLTGTGSAAGLSGNQGVRLAGTHLATGTGGNIDIDGTAGGDVSGFHNTGVELVTASTLTAGGAGAIDIDGTAGSGQMFGRGIYVTGAGSAITSGSGTITMEGTGAGSLYFNRGIELNYVDVSTTGNLIITGNGGASDSFNEGVYVLGGSFSGALNLTGIAAPTSSGIYNIGVYLLSANFGGATGSITGAGGGGTGFNHGIYAVPPVAGLALNGSTTDGNATSLPVAP